MNNRLENWYCDSIQTNRRSIFATATFSSFMAKFCPIQFLKHTITIFIIVVTIYLTGTSQGGKQLATVHSLGTKHWIAIAI